MATRISVQMEHNILTRQKIQGVEDQQATEFEVVVLITILTLPRPSYQNFSGSNLYQQHVRSVATLL